MSTKTFWTQRHKLGFLCDTEWDGNSYCADPVLAWNYEKPEGMLTRGCRWAKIEVVSTEHGGHIPYIKETTKKYLPAYRLVCGICGCTNRATRIAITTDEFNKRFPKCVTYTWKEVEI